ncbi:MAG: hypothetical protein NTZ61_14395 [Proteobacteria bacterium]|nr:hypothetical protein [Pseudomonadota bacterium]
MLDEALRDLRTDRRMLDRRGWITRQELATTLAELPDTADKVAPQEEPLAAPPQTPRSEG